MSLCSLICAHINLHGKLHLGNFFCLICALTAKFHRFMCSRWCPDYCWKQHALCMGMEPRKSYWKTIGMEEKKVLTQCPFKVKFSNMYLSMPKYWSLFSGELLASGKEHRKQRSCGTNRVPTGEVCGKHQEKAAWMQIERERQNRLQGSKMMFSVPQWGPESRWRTLHRSLRRRERRI